MIFPDFSLAYYSGNRVTGKMNVLIHQDGENRVIELPAAPATGGEQAYKPIMVGLDEQYRAVLLDPKTKAISFSETFPEDTFPAHVYSDPGSTRDWLMNDGDKATGNDTLNCGDRGSSVTVIEDSNTSSARYLATICVGRGHHQANFSYPSEQAPQVPYRAYISNLKDGTISVIGNDPQDSDTYLKVVATIDLCEPDKESDLGDKTVPNNSFPHGLTYSPATGKIYNLNNGYGDIVVIDPISNEIEQRVPFKGHTNLFSTPDGRFLIGRGADRKSDPDHIVACLTAMDTQTMQVTDTLHLSDRYISKYYFNADGSKLYLTTSGSSKGTDTQQANLQTRNLIVIDLSRLPDLVLDKEVTLGCSSGSLDFLNEGNQTRYIFSSNSEQGVVAVLNGQSEAVVDEIPMNAPNKHSRCWLLSNS
ncbi:MAG: hypothetical protein D6698_15400 [Gammaproteobacteria bacterium]|nr:MAG: hypothetical protein D6698_15400 [Gammaproteobacteria bacterium]